MISLKQIILNNISSLNSAQTLMARRLIERMSSLIIDKECIESLIDLVEYKIKQKLTPKQRRMLSKRHRKLVDFKAEANKKANKTGRKPKSTAGAAKKRGKAKTNADTSDEDDQDNDEDEDDDDKFDRVENSADEISEDDLTNPNEPDEDDDEDDDVTKTTETSTNREDMANERSLLRHIDDDGERGLKLINVN